MLKIKNMKLYTLYVTLLFGFGVLAQNTITQAEYFVDNDPGVGNANTITLTEATSITETFTIPVNNLTSGIHILHVRTKNNTNAWSLYARQTFYIANFSSALNNTITQAEYFIDNDPGVGNAEPLSISNSSSLNNTFAIPLNAVSTGIHILHIRVKNNFNQWSIYGRQVFYKSAAISNNEIVAAEYFIDTDPGIGSATAVNITQGALIDETLNISIPNNLTAGDHILHIRVLSSNGKWSLYGRPQFTTTLSTDDVILKDFVMHPNPVKEVLHFSNQRFIIKHIKLIDITGKIVFETQHNLKQLDMQTYPSGLYLLQIKTDKGSISKKIIKQ